MHSFVLLTPRRIYCDTQVVIFAYVCTLLGVFTSWVWHVVPQEEKCVIKWTCFGGFALFSTFSYQRLQVHIKEWFLSFTNIAILWKEICVTWMLNPISTPMKVDKVKWKIQKSSPYTICISCQSQTWRMWRTYFKISSAHKLLDSSASSKIVLICSFQKLISSAFSEYVSEEYLRTLITRLSHVNVDWKKEYTYYTLEN
jgi:hypothetical protein